MDEIFEIRLKMSELDLPNNKISNSLAKFSFKLSLRHIAFKRPWFDSYPQQIKDFCQKLMKYINTILTNKLKIKSQIKIIDL